MVLHRAANCLRDPEERDFAAEESFNRDFVSGIERRRHCAAGLQRIERELQALEAVKVGFEKSHLLQFWKIDALEIRESTFGIRERILNRNFHIRNSELCFHGAI